YDGKGNIHEYIVEQIEVVSKIRALGLVLTDNQLVHLIMNNLPPQFGTFLVNYNTLKDMWTLDKLITQCVQEEDRIRQMVKVQNVNMVTS
ncbi:hypothetical protein PJP07_30480, partial [Mycobacterium kansasii]